MHMINSKMKFVALRVDLLLTLIAATTGDVVASCNQTNLTALRNALRQSACRLKAYRVEGEEFRASVRAKHGLPDSSSSDDFFLFTSLFHFVTAKALCHSNCPDIAPENITWCVQIAYPQENVEVCVRPGANRAVVITNISCEAEVVGLANYLSFPSDCSPFRGVGCLGLFYLDWFFQEAYLSCTVNTGTCSDKSFTQLLTQSGVARTPAFNWFTQSPHSTPPSFTTSLFAGVSTTTAHITSFWYHEGNVYSDFLFEPPFCNSPHGECHIDTHPNAHTLRQQRIRVYLTIRDITPDTCQTTHIYQLDTYLIIDNAREEDSGVYTLNVTATYPGLKPITVSRSVNVSIMCQPITDRRTCSGFSSSAEGSRIDWECQRAALPSTIFSLLLNNMTTILPSQPGTKCSDESEVIFLVRELALHVCYSNFRFTVIICSANEGMVSEFSIISSTGGVVPGTRVTLTLAEEQGSVSPTQGYGNNVCHVRPMMTGVVYSEGSAVVTVTPSSGDSSTLSGGIIQQSVVYLGGSIEMSSTILKTAVVTVTHSPEDSSTLSGGIIQQSVVYLGGSIEMSSTILKTAVVTVTHSPEDSSTLSGGIIQQSVVYLGGSIEMSSTILKTAVVTVTPSSGDSSALSGSIMTAIAIAVVAVASLMLLMAVVVVVVVAALRKKSKTENNTRADADVDGYAGHELNLVQQLNLELSQKNMIFPNNCIKVSKVVGQGESGLVYCGYLDNESGRDIVAIKTCKALSLARDKEKLLNEVTTMLSFHHPNVMSLIGMCFDGDMPMVIMPYMSNGSVLGYVKMSKRELLFDCEVGQEQDHELLSAARKHCLDMCHQISKGMQYLAKYKFVHRDLAARNCMIDQHGVIKVADFGLTKDMYSTNYFRHDKSEEGSEEKVPIRWMAPESIENDIYTERTDVWSFGVTCWEIFTCGGVPYAGVPVMSLLRHLRNGHRLDRPSNATCSDEIWDMMVSCWETHRQQRPHFTSLVKELFGLLDTDSNYLKLN